MVLIELSTETSRRHKAVVPEDGYHQKAVRLNRIFSGLRDN